MYKNYVSLNDNPIQANLQMLWMQGSVSSHLFDNYQWRLVRLIKPQKMNESHWITPYMTNQKGFGSLVPTFLTAEMKVSNKFVCYQQQ